MAIEEGTLYPLLRRLESQGLLASEWRIEEGPPRRYYTLSPEGGTSLPKPPRQLVDTRCDRESSDRRQERGCHTMHANEVIEMYIDDIVRLLPRRQRGDVATELRALLSEELHARAASSGRAADEALALSLVRDYGRPNEVAARYRPPLTIIDPSDTWNFLARRSLESARSACSVCSKSDCPQPRVTPTTRSPS